MRFPRATHRVLITSSRKNAEKWKRRIAKYLDAKLKLSLSENKTSITDLRRNAIHFLGFTFKVVRGNSRTGYTARTSLDPERLKAKVAEIQRNIRGLKRIRPGPKYGYDDKGKLIAGINRVNSQIRGIIQYYQAATVVSCAMGKYDYSMGYTAYKALKPHGGQWTPACETDNLAGVHYQYKSQIPAVVIRNHTLGITSLAFCKWTKVRQKNQCETPFTEAGRELYQLRTLRKLSASRADEALFARPPESNRRNAKLYNFEYCLNRGYAFNRDRGKCRVCGELILDRIYSHHANPNLPISRVNRVPNLVSVHPECHEILHDDKDYSSLPRKIWSKILRLREKLNTLS